MAACRDPLASQETGFRIYGAGDYDVYCQDDSRNVFLSGTSFPLDGLNAHQDGMIQIARGLVEPRTAC